MGLGSAVEMGSMPADQQPAQPFSLSRAVREWCFVQLGLIELGGFRRALKERGLSGLDHFEASPWETLDREGLIVPVAYALTPLWEHDLQAALAERSLRLREETGFTEWDALRAEVSPRWGEPGELRVLYHHWQILAVAELQAELRPGVPWGQLAHGLDAFLELRAQVAAAAVPEERLRDLVASFRSRELILVRAQNVFWPSQWGGPGQSRFASGHVVGLTDEAHDWTVEQQRSTDFVAWAAECGVDAEGLALVYRGLVHAAYRVDPNVRILDLLSQVRRGKREQLRGPGRLAADYYDAARMVRDWYHCAAPDSPRLPDVDEYNGFNGTEYKQARYGTLNVDGNRSTLPTLLEDYGLYPWRVALIGEGESELNALRLVLDEGYALSFEHLGISVTDLGGADVPSNAERLLTSMHLYVNYFLLVFDNEGRAREVIDTLSRSGIVEGVGAERQRAFAAELRAAAKQIKDPRARFAAMKAANQQASEQLEAKPGEAPEFVLWRQNFEADNFTHEEMCEIANSFIPNPAELATPVALTELEQELAIRPKTGVATVLVELAAAHLFPFSKPDFAGALGRYALEHREHNGSLRPLLELAEHLIRLAGADRRLAGQLRD